MKISSSKLLLLFFLLLCTGISLYAWPDERPLKKQKKEYCISEELQRQRLLTQLISTANTYWLNTNTQEFNRTIQEIKALSSTEYQTFLRQRINEVFIAVDDAVFEDTFSNAQVQYFITHEDNTCIFKHPPLIDYAVTHQFPAEVTQLAARIDNRMPLTHAGQLWVNAHLEPASGSY